MTRLNRMNKETGSFNLRFQAQTQICWNMLETSSIITKIPETSGAPGSRVSARSTGSGSMDHARVARIGEPVEARASAAGLQLKSGKMLRWSPLILYRMILVEKISKLHETSWEFMSFSNLFWSISMCSPFFNLFLSLVFPCFSLSSSIFLAFHAFAHWQALRCHWAPLQPTSPGPLGLWSGASPAKQSCSWCKY